MLRIILVVVAAFIAATAAFAGLLYWQSGNADEEAALLWQKAAVPRPDVPRTPIDAAARATLATLPPQLRLYLERSATTAALTTTAVEFALDGHLRVGENDDAEGWRPFSGTERIHLAEGFVFRAEVAARDSMSAQLFDYFIASATPRARVRVRAMKLLDIVNLHDEDIERSSLGRAIGELALLPFALYPGKHVTFKTDEANRPVATLTLGGFHADATLYLRDDATLERVRVLRWFQGDGAAWAERPFDLYIREHALFEGWLLPSRIEAGWAPAGEAPFEPFLRANLRPVALF